MFCFNKFFKFKIACYNIKKGNLGDFMKKYFIAGIIYISSIFVVRAYDETRFFINLESPYKKIMF